MARNLDQNDSSREPELGDQDLERQTKMAMQRRVKRAYEAIELNQKLKTLFYTDELDNEKRKEQDMKLFAMEFQGKSEVMLPLASKINDKVLSL